MKTTAVCFPFDLFGSPGASAGGGPGPETIAGGGPFGLTSRILGGLGHGTGGTLDAGEAGA